MDIQIEFSKIIVSLPTIKNKPTQDSLESLYFDNEIHLAECIAFDIMLTDINSLTLLLRSILLHSKNFNTLTQKLFQLFIVITCHKLLNTTFRFVPLSIHYIFHYQRIFAFYLGFY